MLSKNQIEKYAEVLVWALKTVRPSFKKYDTILIRCDLQGLELGEVLHRILIEQKYNVIFRTLFTPTLEKDFYQYSDEQQRKFISAGEKEFYENLNGNVYINAPASLTNLKDIDPKRIGEVAISRKFLRDITKRREEQRLFGWTLCTYPTEQLAKQAKLSIDEYSKQIVKACFLDEKDPVKKWKEIYKNSREIKKWINSLHIDTFRIESASMDLEIKFGDKRRFLGVSGHNIPSFELFTSPDCRYTKGIYFSNLPSFRSGNYAEGVRLEFKAGKVIKVTAKQGEDFTRKILNTDKGAGKVGEFSLTDIRFSKIDKFMADTLFDENHGGRYGNCHIAVGDSYSETYSGDVSKLNEKMKEKLGYNSSAIHWDLVNTEDKKVTAKLNNGKIITIYEKGVFKN
ncbi:MAG: peptidase M29 [Elusimicrobia bacterium RIFOXYD2_FULL_34_15]|nr:MAG: peptidase M29 [Elusimicrobia bacterium RIFOXYD2_FULL_34_15]